MRSSGCMILGVVIFSTPMAQAASQSSSGVFCILEKYDQVFAERIDPSGNMTFAVGGTNGNAHIYSVTGLAKPHTGGWRYQKTSEDPDERCTIDIARAGGGFNVDTVEGARCVNAGGYAAWTAMIGLHFPASSRVKDVTSEFDDEGAILNVDCKRKIRHR
jgi:hypothetical protein